MRVTAVQNGFVVVPSVSDGNVRNASRGARGLHRKAFCTRVSKMTKLSFINEKLNWTSYARTKQSRRHGVQNEVKRCPKWIMLCYRICILLD